MQNEKETVEYNEAEHRQFTPMENELDRISKLVYAQLKPYGAVAYIGDGVVAFNGTCMHLIADLNAHYLDICLSDQKYKQIRRRGLLLISKSGMSSNLTVEEQKTKYKSFCLSVREIGAMLKSKGYYMIQKISEQYPEISGTELVIKKI
jgi:hypothetical protein